MKEVRIQGLLKANSRAMMPADIGKWNTGVYKGRLDL
jgi:hypothetical protein